jgi:alanine racemase
VRPTHVEVDLDAIRHNAAAFRDLISPSELCAVVKADAYGHGDAPVAGAAIDAGATWLAVALAEEGVRLREAGIAAPILLLSEPGVASIPDIVRWELTPTVYSTTFAEALAAANHPLDVHVKVDTGMHRVGAAPSLVPDLLDIIKRADHLDLGAMWTHFAVADEDPEFTERQIAAFQHVIAGVGPRATHLANTAGAALFPHARGDMCRIGLGIYGLHPCQETRDKVQLRPAMRLVSQVTHLQRLPADTRPSYGRIRALEADSTVATVPVGYADGFSRGRGGDVLVRGKRRRLAGRVTMDQIVVVMGDDDVSLGDQVVLMGSQDEEEISADEWAEELGTISYEVVCTIGPRMPRRYIG